MHKFWRPSIELTKIKNIIKVRRKSHIWTMFICNNYHVCSEHRWGHHLSKLLHYEMYCGHDQHYIAGLGIFFAKFTKPTGRGATIVFSRHALISIRDGVLYLQFRLGDLRQNHLIGCSISGHFLAKRKSQEGEVIPYHLSPLSFGCELDGSCNIIQPFWPMVVYHRIDSSSPLYTIAAKDLSKAQFEIIVTLEGTTPETGATIQTRTSYMPQVTLNMIKKERY